MIVKLCGLRSADEVRHAEALGADAVGFVFAESVRRVTPAEAAAASRGTALQRVAVMKHPAQDLLDEVLDGFSPDVLQTDADDLDALDIPAGLECWPVYREGGRQPATDGSYIYEGPKSGAGQTVDWSLARDLARHGRMVLAGGLSPANVGEAIRAVRPWGVDVSSGIESSPGTKDRKKMEAFVAAARAAERDL